MRKTTTATSLPPRPAPRWPHRLWALCAYAPLALIVPLPVLIPLVLFAFGGSIAEVQQIMRTVAIAVYAAMAPYIGHVVLSRRGSWKARAGWILSFLTLSVVFMPLYYRSHIRPRTSETGRKAQASADKLAP